MWYLLVAVWNDFNFEWCGAEADRTFDVSPIPPGSSSAGEVEEEVEIDIMAFARDQFGFMAEASQVEFLASKAKRGIVNCSRQWGKSTLAAIKVLHRAWTRPGSLVLVVSPTLRQSGLFLSKVRRLTKACPEMRGNVKKDPDHALSLSFPNDSLIVGLPAIEGNIRGFDAVSMIVIDEAARVPDIVYKTVRPMLAVGSGDLWLLSTPMGQRGFFYEEFAFGGERWTRFEAPATACPERITAAFLEEELESMGAAWVKQEYFCEFVDMGGTMFDRQLVEDAVSAEIKALVF